MSTQHRSTLGWIVGVIGIVSAVLGVFGLTHPDATSDTPPAVHTTTVTSAPIVPPATTQATTPTATPTSVGRPTRLTIPAIGVDERLEGRGLTEDGALDTPDYGDAAWYEPGPRPGAPGGAVIVAHVHGPDGPDVFWDLATLEPGDVIRVERGDGAATFVVDAIEDVPKEQLPYDRIWPQTDVPLLRLITCGGQRLPQGGYPDNTIVYAHLTS